MASRRQIRNRVFVVLLGMFTVPAIALVLLFTVFSEQRGHPPVAILAVPVVFVWALVVAVLLVVWAILAARDR